MELSQDQVKLLKTKLQKSFEKNTKLMEEFGIKHPTQIEKWNGHELQQRLDSRILGIIGLSKKDLGII